MQILLVINLILCIVAIFAPIFTMMIAPDRFVIEMVFGTAYAAVYLAVMAGWGAYLDRKGWDR